MLDFDMATQPPLSPARACAQLSPTVLCYRLKVAVCSAAAPFSPAKGLCTAGH